ncbi:MAG: RluA family pseudouridine synthase [Pseudomonadales bacterium]|nr:RluA family pseudouridine synthase [Pseudomonadales bacterium]
MGESSEQVRFKVALVDIPSESVGQRLDNFLMFYWDDIPKNRIYRAIRKGEVRVNSGRKSAQYRLKAGDKVRIPPIGTGSLDKKSYGDALPAWVSSALKTGVLYEDDHLLVINKPSGLAVHGGSGVSFGLIEALRKLRPEQRSLELVHRLDRDTSGCIIVAKNRSSLKNLQNQLRFSSMSKTYQMLVVGRWPARKRRVEVALQKNVQKSGERIVVVSADGKASRTDFKVIQRFSGATLLEADLITGRTHQIRVHTQYSGFPIVGDTKYGDDDANSTFARHGVKRLFLHSMRIEFQHPDTAEQVIVEARIDKSLQAALNRLSPEDSRNK